MCMKQSVDKLANLLLARKAIHSLPANTSLTLRELNALVLECQGNSAAAMSTMETISSTIRPKSSAKTLSGLKHETKDVFHPRHPHQAPLSITNTMVSSHHSPHLESNAGFQVSIRQLSSSSTKKQ